MKLVNLRTVGLTTTLSMLGLAAASGVAQADTTASITASSMYLWRGQTLSGAGPAVSGDLYYTHSSGFYTGIWTSSEGISGSHETDLNVGFSKKFGETGFDIGFYEYLYPEALDGTTGEELSLSDSDVSEYYLGASFGPVSAKVLVNTDDSEKMYFTLDGAFGKFGAHIGVTTAPESASEYTDFNLSFTPVQNLTWTISVASGDGAPEEDPLFMVAYKWPFEVK